jgi:hypothetical protein
MRRDISPVELVGLLALCPMAGVGAGLAFQNALVGLMVASIGLIAIAGYGAAAKLRDLRRDRRDDGGGLSVSAIAARRRQAPPRKAPERESSGSPPPPVADPASEMRPAVDAPAEPDRVIPLRGHVFRSAL